MKLRGATQADALDLLAWRNDPVTRAMSRGSNVVGEAAHLAWFRKILDDPGVTLLIGEVDDGKVGMVRFDRGTETEVSINVNPAFRGAGYSYPLLVQALALIDDEVFAEIKDENLASRRIFEKAGFVFLEQRQDRGRFRRPRGGSQAEHLGPGG